MRGLLRGLGLVALLGAAPVASAQDATGALPGAASSAAATAAMIGRATEQALREQQNYAERQADLDRVIAERGRRAAGSVCQGCGTSGEPRHQRRAGITPRAARVVDEPYHGQDFDPAEAPQE